MAEPNNQDPNNQDPNNGGGGNGGDDPKNKSFTQEQLDDIVAKRLNEEKAKTDKLIADKVKEAQDEATRQAKLSADEREKEEREKRERETSQRERDLSLREARIEARDILQSKNISTDLVDFVIDADLEKTKSNIDTLEKAFTKAVEAGVTEKLKGKAPEDFGGAGGDDGGKKKISGTVAF